MNPTREAGKLGIFAVILAAMIWATEKTKGTWFGNIFFKGEQK